MGLSTNTTTYAGGAQTFAVNFALGFLSRADVQVRVNAAVDGSGDPVYTSFSWIDDSAISVIPTLTIGDTVEVLRTVSKTALSANFAANTDVTPANLDISAKQGLMVYQELIDGRVEGTESPIVAGNRAEAAALAAEAATALTAADLLLTNADVIAAAASAAAALVSENAAAADLVLTNADVVLTNADAVDTAADLVQTNIDQLAVAADLVATNQDTIDTAADLVLTNADAAATAADRVQTGLDAAAAALSVSDLNLDQGVSTTDSPTFVNATFTGDVTIGDDLSLTGSTPVITLTDTGASDEYTQLSNSGGATYLDSRKGASDGQIIFRGQGGGVNTEYARFNASGSLGIGISTPLAALDVDGGARHRLRTSGALPTLNISDLSDGVSPNCELFVQSNSSTLARGAAAVYFQRNVSTAEGNVNPHALKVQFTTTGTGDPAAKPWAISAEMTSSTTSNTSGEAGTSLSGVTRKTASNNGVIFGGHLQCKDETDAATLGGMIGLELNIQGNGADTNANRYGMDIIARTFSGGTSGNGRYSAAIRIRNDASTSGKWNTGIIIGGFGEVENTDIAIKTQNSLNTSTGQGLVDEGSKLYGVRANGDYGGGAFAMASDQHMELGVVGGTARIRMVYNSSLDRIEFYKGATLKGFVDMGAGASGGSMN